MNGRHRRGPSSAPTSGDKDNSMSHTRPASSPLSRSSARTVSSPVRPGRRVASTPANVDTRRAAELIGMSRRTLEKWRGEGAGPPFLKLGRRVLYSVADLEDWIRSRRRRSTSEG